MNVVLLFLKLNTQRIDENNLFSRKPHSIYQLLVFQHQVFKESERTMERWMAISGNTVTSLTNFRMLHEVLFNSKSVLS